VVPLTLSGGFGLFAMISPAQEPRGKRSWFKRTPRTRLAAFAVVFVLLISLSLLTGAFADAVSGSSASAQTQDEVYAATYWFKENTPANATAITLSDWRFALAPFVVGRVINYTQDLNPPDAIRDATELGATYIVLTRTVPPSSGINGFRTLESAWSAFPANSTNQLEIVYTSQDVRIYMIR